MSSTSNFRDIAATPQSLYRAITNAEALEQWLAPGEMKGKIHRFDLRVGGSYEMSLYYPATEGARGKTTSHEDRFRAEFIELVPFTRIRQKIYFQSQDPAFSNPMDMLVTIEVRGRLTRVTFSFDNIPPGINPEDNEAGTVSTLEKLANYVSHHPKT